MSDETVVETDGVSVSKFFNAEDFPVPAVAFEVDSSRDDAVTLRIIDEIPDEFGIDQIGFHPEYGSEHWTASGEGVVRFEREVDAGESFTTVYGVRMEDGQDETPFLTAPTVELEGEDIDEVVPPESTSVVRELAGGERETVPGLEDEEAVEVEADVESLAEEDAEILEGEVDLGVPDEEGGDGALADGDASDADEAEESVDEEGIEEEPVTEPEAEGFGAEQPEPLEAEGGVGEPEAQGFDDEVDETSVSGADEGAVSATDEPGESASTGAAAFDASDVASALAEAVRNDEVADDDLATLQDAFGGVPNSTQVEIDHLQSRVSELEAYTDALEEFLDEEGTAQQIVEDVESDVASLSAELDSLGDEVAEVEAGVENAADDREAIRERVGSLEDDLAAVDDLEETVERVRGDVEALDERLADTEDAVLDVEELEGDVDDLEDDLEDLEDHVDEIEQWRDQLSDVFGT